MRIKFKWLFCILQRHKTDARPCNVGTPPHTHTYINMPTDTPILYSYSYLQLNIKLKDHGGDVCKRAAADQLTTSKLMAANTQHAETDSAATTT